MLNWIKIIEGSSNVNLTQTIITEKGRKFNSEINENPIFIFSHGWFRRFLIRNKIYLSKSYGDAGLVDLDKYEEEINRIKELLETFDPDDIYNNNELSFFGMAMPNKSYGTQQFKGSKKKKKDYHFLFLQILQGRIDSNWELWGRRVIRELLKKRESQME